MNRSILITGASSGIGAALAEELAGRGFRLALTARRFDVLQQLRGRLLPQTPSGTVEIARLDVTDYESVREAIPELGDRVGGLDIVMANAGTGRGEKIGQGAFPRARQTIEVNLLGAMATVDAAVSYFRTRGGGHVVGTCSVAAFRGTVRGSSYAASKAGLSAYLESLRVEALSENIAVTVLYPGYIDTPLNDMLPNRPFLISAQKGARIIADAIEHRARRAFIPRFPWSVFARMLRILPAAVVARL
jgi:short-subunit dehydrogenase